jgi:hypothetical protein
VELFTTGVCSGWKADTPGRADVKTAFLSKLDFPYNPVYLAFTDFEIVKAA